ncbi:hypothetical protein [Exiguobacterium antarcticum]|uniref:hypothetical protein n=1 Tax=Exiguobacterium antarcticum TaxID=132920 RepID=UPI00047DA661|nr:hypothetical protein [Exiguobacterium antarcticum]
MKVEFVPTTWATLTRDLRAGGFHNGSSGGVTKNIEREIVRRLHEKLLVVPKNAARPFRRQTPSDLNRNDQSSRDVTDWLESRAGDK